MNALLRKEIRDAVRWLPIGIVLLGILLTYVCRSIDAPILSSQLFMATWFSALLYGLFLSLVTFLPDEREAARAFLIQRAITPEQIFRTRVLVGLVVYGLGMFIPLVVLAVYLAAIGPERLPVSPWQVMPACSVVVVGSIFYFAGIVVACRLASWFGTRLLPLAAAVGGSMLSISVLAGAPIYISLPIYAMSCGCALMMAVAARHAFVRMPHQVHPTLVCSPSLAMRFILLSSSLLFVGAVGLLPINFITQPTYRYSRVELGEDGMPVYVVRGSNTIEVLETIPIIEPSEPRPERFEVTDIRSPFVLRALVDPSFDVDPRLVVSIGNHQVYFDPSGYLLVYKLHQVFGSILECVVSSDAVSLPNESRGMPFQRIPRFSTEWAVETGDGAYELVFVASDGIWKVDLGRRTVELLLKESIDCHDFGWSIDSRNGPDAEAMDRVLIQSKDSLRIYKCDATYRTLPTQFTLESTVKTAANAGGVFWYRNGENWTYLDGYGVQRKFDVTRCSEGMSRAYTFDVPVETLSSLGRMRSESRFVFGALPPLLTVGSLTITQTASDLYAIDYLPLLIQLLVACTLTVWVARLRGVSPRQTSIWVVLAALLGVGVPLAVIAIYPVAVYDICSACGKRRRVEQANCEHCGADWDPLPTEGIEIVEGDTVKKLATVG